jgi:glutamate-1-semialdehyde 2,1-aminomutase
VGSEPFFVRSASGAVITDVDGNDYVDFVQSWGALLFGHADPDIVEPAAAAARRGTSFGTPSELEVELARLIAEMVPNADLVRFVSSGTEAAMTAVRLARGVTGRRKVLKFSGCYHGHLDSLLVDAGSGVATLGVPGSPGVTPGATADTLLARYNDLASAHEAAEPYAGDLAAIVVEPVAANMGLVLPIEGFLKGLRSLADETGALLILDEVITGFRLAPGGAQERLRVDADLVLLGKVMGGGFPAAAVAGRAEIMERLSPTGPVYQAGTLSGNPVAMAAGAAALSKIKADPALHPRLQDLGITIVRGLVDAAERAGVPLVAAAFGGLAGLFFAPAEVSNYDEARNSDGGAYARFFTGMLERGFYLPPSRFEALFPSAAHTSAHAGAFVAAAEEVLFEMGH